MITLKTQKQINQIRENGTILREAVDKARKATQGGVTTAYLDSIIEKHIRKQRACPIFQGYGPVSNPFPSSSCISVNEIAIHGIPDGRKIKEGDLISIDVGVLKNGMIADQCITYGVGNISTKHKELMKAAKEITSYGVSLCKSGLRLHDLARGISAFVSSNYKEHIVIPGLFGHGCGVKLHEAPRVPFVYPTEKEVINYELKKEW